MTLVDKLSHQVRIILKHFQGPEPVGIPGQTILTEPLYAPDANASLVLATGYFYNITIWGLSNFTINVLNTKLDDMEVSADESLAIGKVVIGEEVYLIWKKKLVHIMDVGSSSAVCKSLIRRISWNLVLKK